MASLRSSLLLLLTFFLLLTCISFVVVSSQNDAVTVSLYYETLCPYCADFIVNHLVKVFDEGLISIVNLRMIPWGNAFLQSDGSFACQHGPNECFLNAIEACAITIYPNVETHFRFIHCIERLSLENKLNEWVNCFEMARIGKEPIDCSTSGYGNVLEQQFATETAQLYPQHRFVPWVVVNNLPLQEDFKNFVSHICKAYQGTQVPEACKSIPMEINSARKENPISPVCYVNKTGKLTSSASSIKAL